MLKDRYLISPDPGVHPVADRDEQEPSHRRGSRSWLTYGVVGIALLLAGAVLVGIVALAVISWRVRSDFFAAQAEVRAEVARIQAAGEPLSVADLYALHRRPAGAADSTTAWLEVLATFDTDRLNADLKSLPTNDGQAGVPSVALSTDERALIEGVLGKYQPTVRAAIAASSAPGECRWPVKYENGVSVEIAHVQAVRRLVQLLSRDVWMRSFQGDSDRALASLAAMLAASGTFKNQPSVVEQAARLGTLGVALREARKMLLKGQLGDTQLGQLQLQMDAIDIDGGLVLAMLGERALGYQMDLKIKPPGIVQLPQGDTEGRDVGNPDQCQKWLELMSSIIDASRLPFPQARNRSAAVQAEYDAAASGWSESERERHRMTIVAVEWQFLAFTSHANVLALRDALRVAIAAEQFRRKTGTFPDQLSQLVPDYLPVIPQDPFDGKPLRARADDSGFVVYSVGANLKDDGGIDDRGWADPDIPVRLTAR